MESGRDEKSGAGLYHYPCAESLPAIFEGVMETQERHVHIVQPKETFLAIQSPSRGAQSFFFVNWEQSCPLKMEGRQQKIKRNFFTSGKRSYRGSVFNHYLIVIIIFASELCSVGRKGGLWCRFSWQFLLLLSMEECQKVLNTNDWKLSRGWWGGNAAAAAGSSSDVELIRTLMCV